MSECLESYYPGTTKYLMYLSKAARDCITSSDIPIFQQKDSKGVQYDIISHKESIYPRMQRHNNHNAQYKPDYDIFKYAKDKYEGTP